MRKHKNKKEKKKPKEKKKINNSGAYENERNDKFPSKSLQSKYFNFTTLSSRPSKYHTLH